jgi:heme-degrading monooxygenase HmoA
MIVVMNILRAHEGRAEDLERAFLNRERLLNGAEGFAGFEFLRRDSDDEYVVLTRWESQDHFWDWVHSNRFQKAHRKSQNELATGPELRYYDVLDVEAPVA